VSDTFRGRCLCGAIHFEAGDVFDAGLCHCSLCRRIGGAAAVFWANSPSHAFRVLRGETRAYRSSERFERHFCPTCGTAVFGRNPDPTPGQLDLVSFNPALLDDPEAIRPTAHIWWQSRAAWFEPGDTLERFPEGELSHPAKRPSWRAP
jgi:hypothetical protein